jgi:hypothetical protein
MAGMLKRVAPLSYEAWIDYDLCGVRFSRMEMEALRALVRPAEDGLAALAGALSRAELAAKGLGRREIDELLAALVPAEAPDFELDLTRAKPAAYFEEKAAAAVPASAPPPSVG